MRRKYEMTGGPRRGLAILLALLLAGSPALIPSPASALSEIKREELPAPATPSPSEQSPYPGDAVPLPGPIQVPDGPEDDAGQAEGAEAEIERPEIQYDLALLPEPVRRMHGLIVEACKSGDIEALRPLLGTGEGGTQLSFGGTPADPIELLKELSGDDEGHEILAILLEVMGAGFAHLDAGTPSELYVWPYFFAVPLDSLTAPQRVELFTLITAGDYEDMKAFGAYIFYRAGITPEGRWAFFVAGD